MKKSTSAAALAAAIALFAFRAAQRPIYAASSIAQTEHAPATAPPDKAGADSYADHCSICHGDQREGILPAFPPLLGIDRQMSDQQIIQLIHGGKGRMPGFPKLQDAELTALLHYLATSGSAVPETASGSSSGTHLSGMAAAGGALFRQNCAFCHGRDAMGGETGPDLTRSKLVQSDVGGNKISEVVREGRAGTKMPAFNFSSQELLGVVAFIHAQEASAVAMKGKRRGVDVSDLQTGNVEAGKQYFNGAGTCAKCHSAAGDLAGIATRYEGLQLEERMLYPKNVKSHVVVTLPSGGKVSGTVAYLDEFTIGLRDSSGTYRSWATKNIKYKLDSPVEAHVELFGRYTDADIHNLMAYIQTLR